MKGYGADSRSEWTGSTANWEDNMGFYANPANPSSKPCGCTVQDWATEKNPNWHTGTCFHECAKKEGHQHHGDHGHVCGFCGEQLIRPSKAEREWLAARYEDQKWNTPMLVGA